MGLTETLNSDLTSSSGSNNIDVHMEKNTEYGALAILSASSYGNPNKIGDRETTTGNATGAVMNINNEWVAAGCLGLAADNFKNAVIRYKDIYDEKASSYIAKSGDAIIETSEWHGSTNNSWEDCYGYSVGRTNGLIRSCSGSIFSYSYGGRNKEHTDISKLYSTRAVVVSGQGL